MKTTRHRNADERRALKTAEISRFLREYGRKAQNSGDPNDRHYDRDVEGRLRRMPVSDLDRLMHEDD